MNYKIICWPESQNLMDMPGFKDNCRLVNGKRGIEEFGSSAYLVDMDWYKNPTGNDDGKLDMVFDKELEALYLM